MDVTKEGLETMPFQMVKTLQRHGWPELVALAAMIDGGPGWVEVHNGEAFFVSEKGIVYSLRPGIFKRMWRAIVGRK